jgi:hypothetical protein
MNKIDILKEQFNEEMFERRANGIDTVSFEQYKKRREFIENFMNSTPDPESMADAVYHAEAGQY